MPDRLLRSFTLLDLLILVAATAVGFGTIRMLAPDNQVFTSPYSPITPPTWLNYSAVVASNWAFYLSPLLASCTLGSLTLRLRHPRPKLRRLATQPGWVACCAAAAGIGVGLVMTAVGVAGGYGIMHYFELVPYPVGVAVAGSWAQLAAGGRWRPEATWSDRLGRVIGAIWLAMIPLVWGRYYLTT